MKKENEFLNELNFDNVLDFELTSDKVVQSFSLKDYYK